MNSHVFASFQETFQFPPKEHRLNMEEQAEVNTLLSTRPKKKMHQDHIRKTTGKMVTLREITNHANKLVRKRAHLEDIIGQVTEFKVIYLFQTSNTFRKPVP